MSRHALSAGFHVIAPTAGHSFVSTDDEPLTILFVYRTPERSAPTIAWVCHPIRKTL